MTDSLTRAQDVAMIVILIAVVAIAIAAPIVALGPRASLRARVAGGLTALEMLITVVRRMLSL
jgi:hypothetical protein